jgi:hypothetical protein
MGLSILEKLELDGETGDLRAIPDLKLVEPEEAVEAAPEPREPGFSAAYLTLAVLVILYRAAAEALTKEKNRVLQAAGTAFDHVEKRLYGFYFRLTGREEDVEPESMPVKPERSVFVLSLVTLAIASRLVAEGFAEAKNGVLRAAGKTARAVKARVYDAYDGIDCLIWDSVDGARECIGEKGLAKSLAIFGWKAARKAVPLMIAAACVIVWSLIWSVFGFTGTWQLFVKIGFIGLVFVTLLVVEYT